MTTVYAYKNNEAELMKSSSGGAFIAVCEAFEWMHGAGKVSFFGATFDESMRVVHMGVDTTDECHQFQGSKYVKSNTSGIFEAVAKKLKDGKFVLFSGVPCQINALDAYLKRCGVSNERLFLIDIICHGVPYEKFWLAFKDWLEKRAKSRMTKYSFRYKPEGWKAYPGYARFENNTCFINTPETAVYSSLHMKCLSISKSCFSCPFANEKRLGDLTLGDYWGIEQVNPDIPYKKGVSLVLSHTDKSEALLAVLSKYIGNGSDEVLVQTEGTQYLEHQHNLNAPTSKPSHYEEFWKDYKENSFEYVIKKYLGYGPKYRLTYNIKKIIRKTPLIYWYRNSKRHR